jgi:MtfA peptidase
MRWPWTSRAVELDLDALASIVTRNVRLADGLDEARRHRLLEFTADLVRSKRWEAVRGSEIDDEMRITISANAAIPLLGLDLGVYRQVQAIVVRPGASVSNSPRSGRVGGTFSDQHMATIGEAFPNSGPVALSWDAVKFESRHPAGGRNVVIHEFAHKIDMSDGYTDGIPPLRGAALEAWAEVIDDEFGHTDERADDEVLDPYAWTNRAEFFAVSTETFFCRPAMLAAAKPVLYRALADYFQQDPANDRLPL